MKAFVGRMMNAGRERLAGARWRATVILAIGALRCFWECGAPGATGTSEFSPLPKRAAVELTNAIILVSPKALDFGPVPAGKTVTDTFLVENVGGGKLVGSVSVSAPFKIISGGDYALKEKQIQVVTIAYTAAGTSAVSGRVTFTGGGGAKATVIGKAIPPKE